MSLRVEFLKKESQNIIYMQSSLKRVNTVLAALICTVILYTSMINLIFIITFFPVLETSDVYNWI